jgi:JmjC domain
MTAVSEHLIELDPANVEAQFGRSGFAVRHQLQGHPLTQLDALAELADSLPPDRVEHNLATVGDTMPGGEVPQADLSPGDMVRTIETNGCWMVLPIHGVPSYRELFDALFDEVLRPLPAREGAVLRRQGVFFLSAPNSTTPTHIDMEQGYLLQLMGTKQVRVGDFPDPDVAHREVERFCAGGHRNIADLPHDAKTFDMSPGDGVHVPALVPHLVKTPAGVSISLSVGFETEAVIRRAAVHRANASLRRIGLRPARPGEHPRGDRAKERLVTAASRAAGLARRRS